MEYTDDKGATRYVRYLHGLYGVLGEHTAHAASIQASKL